MKNIEYFAKCQLRGSRAKRGARDPEMELIHLKYI